MYRSVGRILFIKSILRIFTVVFVTLLAAFAGQRLLQAQDFRSTLTGQVNDPSGAIVRGASVTAVNNANGTRYTGKSTAKGVYYIPYMLPGTYTVSVDVKGFKTAVQDNVLLQASETFNQNFALQMGSVGEKVVVTSAPPLLETSTGSGGTVINQRTLQNVPLNGGQVYGLIGTTPGSQFTTTSFGTGGSHGTTGYDVSNSYTIGGGIVGNNQFTLNGTNITSQTTYDNQNAGEWTIAPNIDSVQEMNVMTNTYDARYGRTSGGTVNVVGRSGSNAYHASARYAYEGSFMNANVFQNNLTDSPRQGEVQNQFWITAGGPVLPQLKNRLFFFFGFEGYRQALAGSTLENVPPAYLRPGYQGNAGVNFGLVGQMDPSEFPTGLPIFQPNTAYCLDGAQIPVTTCNPDHVGQTQFANNTIPANQINGTATNLLQHIPLPNIASAANLAKGANYIAHTPDLYGYNQPQIRVDYNLNNRTKLYSYFAYTHGTQNQSTNGLTGIAEHGSINHIEQTWVATQDATYTFSPSMIGDFKASFDRFYTQSPDGDLTTQTNPSTLGLGLPLPGITTSEYLPEFTVNDNWGTGFLSDNTLFGNQLSPSVTNNYTLNVDFTKTAGAHTFEFGGEIDEFQFGGPPYSGGHPNGDFSFNSGWTQFNPQNQNCYPIVASSSGGVNGCSSNTPNGSSLASLYLGYPASGGVDWDPSLKEGYPVFAEYFQDNWRVNHQLTLNFGIRYDIQRGLRERNNYLNRGFCTTCINPLTNEPAYQANVASGANQAAWAAAGINPASLATVVGGIQFAGGPGQSRDAYDTDYSDVGPRFGFAFAIDPKTVVRGGYGIMYSYGLEGGSSYGEAQTTTYTGSLNGGYNPTTYFQSGAPFSSGLLAPTGDSQGLLTNVGNGTTSLDFPNRKIPMEQIVSLGIQRELPGNFVLDASYDGNFSSRLRVDGTSPLWLNGTQSLTATKAAIADPTIWSQQVPNPYYNVPGMDGPGQCGTSPTVEAIALLGPYSQYCTPGGSGLIGDYDDPLGRNWFDGLEVKLTRQTSHGLTVNMSYTYSKTINGDGYQNGWPYQDPFEIHWLAASDRTHIFSFTSVYDLPVGRGGLFYTQPDRVMSFLVSHWVLGSVFSAQSGTPVGVNTSYQYHCGSYKPAGGSSVGQGHWFGDSSSPAAISNCWTGNTTWELGDLSGTTGQVRNPTTPNLDLSLEKTEPIHENLNFTLRLDAFNSFNSVLFGGPDTNPGDGAATFTAGSGWSGFGTVGATQQNFPRILQVSGKIDF